MPNVKIKTKDIWPVSELQMPLKPNGIKMWNRLDLKCPCSQPVWRAWLSFFFPFLTWLVGSDSKYAVSILKKKIITCSFVPLTNCMCYKHLNSLKRQTAAMYNNTAFQEGALTNNHAHGKVIRKDSQTSIIQIPSTIHLQLIKLYLCF